MKSTIALTPKVSIEELQELWNKFGDIAINNDDEIESDFMQFKAGTYRFVVWHWFDERCPNNLHDDLLYKEVDS